MSRKMSRLVNVIDVESTCWELPEIQPKDEISEIIEIGIAVVDIDKLEVVQNESILVKPQRSRLSKFCTKLTTLTQIQVNKGITFQDAMTSLYLDYDSANRTFVSWGDYDRKMFERNCKDYNVKYPFGPRHMNIKNTFAIFNGLDREVGLDAGIDHFGMTMKGTHHRGVDDARNIADIFVATIKLFRSGWDGIPDE